MTNWSLMNHRLQRLTLKVFRKICSSHDIVIGDGDLKVILRIIKNNPYPVLNEEYTPILLFEISKETNPKICRQFKPIIEEKYLIQEME
ncbi:hypothetical protein [Candidatus Stoquefichus massiliensis]|uniref:hypothetical protein n=1 Tax=Candidatus Stoquefichus massiliensis TaxID=1470350 RepID=UPI00048A2FE4|nr:hypothetical protein [Candidatus Stoquefichus massiliensis]